MNTADSVMVLATRFDNPGDWTVEQQFVLQMGSSYMLAHGIGTPLEKDAEATFDIPSDGEYTMFVRTDVPYTQFYHQVDRTGHQAEDR